MSSGKKTLKPIPGVVKQALSMEQTPRLKELTSVYRGDQSTLKLQGSKMAVPPLKTYELGITDRQTRVNSPLKSASKSDSGSSTKSYESTDRKELRESQAKERKLNQKIADLNKIIDYLRKQLKEKDVVLRKANELLKVQEEDFKSKLLKETHSHIQTKCLLDQKREQLTKAEKDLQSATEKHEQMLKKVQEEKEMELAKLRLETDKEIAKRDDRLLTMKKQMADILMGNSKERQQQLEELTRELSRMQEEIEVLNFKIKSYRSKQTKSCPGCKDLTDEVNKTKALSRSQNETVRELQVLCAKLEIQLETQDDLLKQFADSEANTPTMPYRPS